MSARNAKAALVLRPSQNATTVTTNSTKKSAGTLLKNWRQRMPHAGSYYRKTLANLSAPDALGWATATCPLHADDGAALSIHIAHERGGWRCAGPCGTGDLITFHMKRKGLRFGEAVNQLVKEDY